MFDAINCQRARQELDFVAEYLAGRGAGQEDCIGKNTPAERQVEGRGASVFKGDGLGPVGLRGRAAENDGDVGEVQCRLIHHDGGNTPNLGKRHLPRPVFATAMLNPIENGRVAEQRSQEDDEDWLPEGGRSGFGHVRSCEKFSMACRAEAGGADRNRTCDLLIANETLYQLSYDPIHFFSSLL